MCKGNTIFSRSSWGRNEAKTELGLEISKTNLGSIEVAKEYWHVKASYYEHIGMAVDELIIFSQNISPTENGNKVRDGIREIWERWKTQITDINEKAIFRNVVVNTGLYFKESSSIGRKQLREKILMEICNHI